MTQHFLDAKLQDGTDVSVMVGYDRPLKSFFGLVERLESLDEDDEGIVYSNLNTNHPTPSSFEVIIQDLQVLGIQLPAKMVAEIEEDALLHRGNICTKWNNDGSKQPSSEAFF